MYIKKKVTSHFLRITICPPSRSSNMLCTTLFFYVKLIFTFMWFLVFISNSSIINSFYVGINAKLPFWCSKLSSSDAISKSSSMSLSKQFCSPNCYFKSSLFCACNSFRENESLPLLLFSEC